MKYIFIINPSAGRKKSQTAAAEYKAVIESYFSENPADYEICLTNHSGHAGEIVSEMLPLDSKGESFRFYGFGGDGTLLEIARACVGKDNAAVGIFPLGSGNDFVRIFGRKEPFLSVSSQVRGHVIKMDAIRTLQGDAFNICAMGLDAKVAYNMDKFKNIPCVSGSLAYDLSLVKCLLGKLGENLEITVKTSEGERHFKDRYIFALGANGQYYGGGYRGAPKAVINDGLLDFVLIKKPPFIKIPSRVGVYKRGEHLESEKFSDILTYLRGTEMTIKSAADAVSTRDGECSLVKEEKYTVMPSAVNFIIPEGIEYQGFIQEKRVYLRPWMPNDLDDLFYIMSNENVMIPSGGEIIKDKEKCLEQLRKMMQNPWSYAIVLRDNNKVIGSITYQRDVHRPDSVKSRSIGYELNEDYWGHGYMPEALRGMVKNAFENTDTEVISIGYTFGNERSKHVIEKCGFKFEGVVRKCFRDARGILNDDYSYSMTREDYLELKENQNV